MRKQIFLLTCLLLASIGWAGAQSRTISGKVVSAENEEPIIGATISVKGTTSGTISDADGAFRISIPSQASILVVSFIGTKPVEVEAKEGVVVRLVFSDSELDEVVVTAYGTAKKSAITGSVAKVSSEDLMKKNQSEITKALVGEVAGMQVITTSGQPGTNATVRIRGFGSVNSSRAPLYVVDGVPYEGDISAINNADVESTTVLKDAAASALYGAKAANGVILITTKKGDKSKSTIDVDAKYGINIRLMPLYDVIDSPERFAELGWESLRNYGLYRNGLSAAAAGVYASNNLFDKTRGISSIYNMWETAGNSVIDPATGRFSGADRKYTPEKWADHIFDVGEKTEASVRFSGGADKLSYYTSFGLLDEKGYYIGSDFSRLSARTNLIYEPRTWLKATTNLSYAYMDMNNAAQTDAMNNGFQFINGMPAIYPVYQRDANGNLILDPSTGKNRYDYGQEAGYERGYASGINPVGTINLDATNTVSHQFMGNANFEISFLKDFKFISSNGYQYLSARNVELLNPFYGDAKGAGRISKEYDTYIALTTTQMLSYKKTLEGVHNINAFVAHESSMFELSMDYAAKKQLAKPDNREFANAITMTGIEGYTLGRSMESYFAQAKYDYDEKYFADINFRRDGSSRFVKNRWGNFWSAGAAWLVSKEDFMKDIDFVNNLRIKASYGTYGNEAVNVGSSSANYYPTQNLYSVNNLNGAISYALYYIGNPDLTWEKSSMLNTGIDVGLWSDRLIGEVEFFKKTTTDMIFNKQVATSLGYAALPVNDASLDNTGVEFKLTGSVVKTSDLEIKLTVNGAHYTNTLTKMPMEGSKEKNFELQEGYGWSKGHSIFDYYMRDYAGVNTNTGQSEWVIYYDNNNLTSGNPTKITNMVDYLAERAEAGETVDLKKDVTTNYADATLDYVGKSAIPDLTGAFGIDVKYKGIEFSAQFIYGIGGYGYDAVYAQLMHNETVGSMNWHKDMEQRWTAPGQITSVPRLSATHDTYVISSSSRFLTSMNYLGLNNVRVGYTFPKKMMSKIKVDKLTTWVSGDNLYMSTARKGYYPIGSEVGESGRSQYIPLSTVMAGISVQF